MEAYDAIVVGVGGVGSAALFHLAARGASVLGIDRFPVGHDRGSSHGETRIIRQAYLENPNYVPLAQRSYELWKELESDCGTQLFVPAGLVYVGNEGGSVLQGVSKAAAKYSINIEELNAADVRRRFPGLHVDDQQTALFEPEAGFLHVEACVNAHVEAARARGAELAIGESVESWAVEGDWVTVSTTARHFKAKSLVVAAGAWSSQVLHDLRIPLEVQRKPLLWYETKNPLHASAAGMPAFCYEIDEHFFYGFPSTDAATIKLAEHTGVDPVDDPLAVDRQLRASDREPVEEFASRYLPGVTKQLRNFSICLYTTSPDTDFIVDRHPTSRRIAFAAGLSGHGFKFTPALGEALAELASDGSPPQGFDFLAARRFTG